MQGRKPTRKERKSLAANKLDTYKWLILKENSKSLQIIRIDTGEVRTIPKV